MNLLKLLWLFLGLNFADLVLTYCVIQAGGDRIYEGNPVAAEWLARYGWPGMIVFKAMACTLFACACFLLATHRPKLASALASTIWCVVGAVVLYSANLSIDVDKRGGWRQGVVVGASPPHSSTRPLQYRRSPPTPMSMDRTIGNPQSE